MARSQDDSWSLDELTGEIEKEQERRRMPAPAGRAADRPSARTVRYYATLGLLDRPLGYRGGSARYGRRHLLQFLAIKAMQAEYLPLPEIQKRLYGRTDAELLGVVDAVSGRTPPGPPPAQTWLAHRPAPGLVMLVEDREALNDWLRRSSPEEVRRALEESLEALAGPADPGPHTQKEEPS